MGFRRPREWGGKSSLLDKLYKGNTQGLVSTLIQREMLSATDYEELWQFWEKEVIWHSGFIR